MFYLVGDQRLCDVCHYLGDMLPAAKMVLRQAQKNVYSETGILGTAPAALSGPRRGAA